MIPPEDISTRAGLFDAIKQCVAADGVVAREDAAALREVVENKGLDIGTYAVNVLVQLEDSPDDRDEATSLLLDALRDAVPVSERERYFQGMTREKADKIEENQITGVNPIHELRLAAKRLEILDTPLLGNLSSLQYQMESAKANPVWYAEQLRKIGMAVTGERLDQG